MLDVNLDGEKVYEVADALIDGGVPVVFVTGYDRTGMPRRYDDVPLCTKPVATNKVIDALRTATRKRAAGGGRRSGDS